MKKVLFCLCVAMLSIACDNGNDAPPAPEEFKLSQDDFTVSRNGETIQVDVETNTAYTVEMPDKDWVNEQETGSGVHTRYFVVDPNDTDDEREATITFVTKSGKRHPLTITQGEQLTLYTNALPSYSYNYETHTLTFDVSHTLGFNVNISADATGWIVQDETPNTGTRALQETTVSFTITENTGNKPRSGSITIFNGVEKRVVINVDQNCYVSEDYSKDGHVTIVQEATAGNGIDIVFMGDGYTDKLIADGTYMNTMNKIVGYYFDVEPHKSFREMYNVYIVTVVSEVADGFGTSSTDESRTALKGWLGNGTSIGGNNTICMDYAEKALTTNTSERMNEALVVVVLNKVDDRSGTCYWGAGGGPASDYSRGWAIAYQSLSFSDNDLKGLIQHEAGGHGFAKLHDEYVVNTYGAIPQNERDMRVSYQNNFGWYKNIDFTNDPATVRWAHFMSDGRYNSANTGESIYFYAGALYTSGIWKSTIGSIMNTNFGRYNAISREAIYYRLHKLAYGQSWQYNYEDFVAYDTSVGFGVQASSAASHGEGYGTVRNIQPPTPPVIYNSSWEEMVKQK